MKGSNENELELLRQLMIRDGDGMTVESADRLMRLSCEQGARMGLAMMSDRETWTPEKRQAAIAAAIAEETEARAMAVPIARTDGRSLRYLPHAGTVERFEDVQRGDWALIRGATVCAVTVAGVAWLLVRMLVH